MTDLRREKQSAADDHVPHDDRVIGRAFWWSIAAIAILAAGVTLTILLGKDPPPAPVVIDRPPIEAPAALAQSESSIPVVPFTDITKAAGIDFIHTSGATGEKLLPETMGGGCTFFDYDDDGDQDILFVNAMPWPESASGSAPPTMSLYRNNGSGTFENVTAGSGLDESFYGMGAAVGDYDNDGDTDVFITAVGANRLFRNDGGTFREVGADAGVAGDANTWSTSAGFLDYDNDGDLDLFVCNYVQWSRDIDLKQSFTLNGKDRAYGPPKLYMGTDSYLYRNDGDGTFADVTRDSGISISNPATGEPMGKALAVTFVDADRDGFLDIFVANDTIQNFAFRNRGDGTFEEVGAVSGFAFDTMGASTGAMGMDAGEFANDGVLGVAIGNFANESSSFYVQQRDPWRFADVAAAEGIGSPSRLRLSFGLFLFDYDLDGRLDLLQANGHLEETINEIQPSQHYHQPAQLFWNCGPGARSCFAAVPEQSLGDFARPIVGRGAAYADIDNDGDLDVLMTQIDDRPLLLRNDQQLGHHWLRVRLRGTQCNSSAIGAWIEMTAGGITQRRQVMPTRSYLSQVELPVTFGLGPATAIDSLRVIWPDGGIQTILDVPIDSVLEIDQAVPGDA